ncbi:MAG: MFS transporter [Chloroflexi bacterium]|nr:MFS transporter [Chloroflexota bacterium]
MQPAILAPLQHRPFRSLFAGQVVSDLGDWLDFLAVIALIVYRWELGATALAAYSVVLAIPTVVVAPAAGVWIDRWPRKRVMIACDLVRAVVAFGLAWAPDLGTLLGLVLVKGIAGAFFGPARQATIRATVPEADLLAAGSLSQLSVQTGKIVGPALGGLLVALAGARAAFVADALSFLASAAILTSLPNAAASESARATVPPSFREDLLTGLRHIAGRRTLVAAIGSMGAALFIIFTFDSISALGLKELGLGESLLGLAIGSIGLGTALGAVAIGQWGQQIHPFLLMGAGQILCGALVGIIGAAILLHARGTEFAWIPVWLLIGAAAAAITLPYVYVLQSETPPELIGRVSATANAVQTALQLVAPPSAAVLTEWLGVGFVFAGTGTALAVLGLIVLLCHPSLGLRSETAGTDLGARTT